MTLVAPDQSVDPVFVVGMNGSGTSMLTECLGRHPQLYAFPGETRMIPHFIDHQASFGDLNGDESFLRLWQYVNRSVPDFTVFNGHEDLSVPENWREFPRTLAAILDAIFRQFAAKFDKARWCEKSPNNSEHMLRLAELFPTSKFVHIVRDGRDCAASTNRRQHRNPELTVFRWRQIVAEARRQGAALDSRYFELRYEDLTADPEFNMRNVCRFLNLEFDTQVLESTMPQSARKSQLGTDKVGRIEPNSQKFRTYFSAGRIRKLEQISGLYLEQLDYPVVYCRGNRSIGRLRAARIRLVDFFKANWQLRQKLTGKSHDNITWRTVLRRMLASVREYAAKKY